MKSGQRSMFLIDADNVAVEVIEKALALKQELHGAIHVKRCYCSADFAVKNLAFLKEHSIRAMVNVTAGKNCTDIALAIDAVQLCEYEPAGVVVIVGSDSDFAPLVMHLRDRGCRVEGVGQEGKTGAESHLAYDDFVELPVGKRAPARTAPARPASARPAARAVRAARSPAAKPPAPPPPVPAEVADLLAALPELASGETVELKRVADPLRKAKLLSKSGSSPKLFKKLPDWFELVPEKQPTSVRFLGTARAR